VRVIQLEAGDRVVAVAKLAEPDEGDDEPQESLPVAPEPPREPAGGTKKPGAPFLDEDDDEDEE
jgi:hypothetical protein